MRYIFAWISAVLMTGSAFAQELVGQPTPGAIGFQPAATRIMERVNDFHNYLLWFIVPISLFVLGLLIWVCLRYNRRANPVARKFSHNTTVEIIWTAAPVIILVAIAGPSFSNLFYQENEPDLEMIAQSGDLNDPNVYVEAAKEGWITVKAEGMGNWAWTYYYPDEIDNDGYQVQFPSLGIHFGFPECTPQQMAEKNSGQFIQCDPPATPEKPLYLAADNPMVIPVNRYIRYQTTSDRVIHSWTVPAFGVKTDAVPGRLNEGWFLVEETGVYYGQCSELCGKNHAFMPIEVRVVPQEQYDRWLEVMKTGDIEGATDLVQIIDPMGEPTRLASVE